MKIDNGKVVATSYELFTQAPEDDFEMVEQVSKEDPMYYLSGHSGLPPAFEEKLNGLTVGDTFSFEISAEDGFGEYYEENLVDFDIDMFKIEDGNIPEGILEPGNVIPFTNDDGTKIQGRINEVVGEKVNVDFNHPLAGKTLRFNGEIIEVRDATQEELEHGHVHGEGGIQH